jgi:tetratricopeptide (TPR) repeat protein
MDDLQKAYTAYQQALYHLPNPKEPKLWYGIGILYDRYGSLEHAEDAFSSVLRMDPSTSSFLPHQGTLLAHAQELDPAIFDPALSEQTLRRPMRSTLGSASSTSSSTSTLPRSTFVHSASIRHPFAFFAS